jgi:hypothetical protein
MSGRSKCHAGSNMFQLGQNVLRLHLNNGRYIKVFEADDADTLKSLGLDAFVEDYPQPREGRGLMFEGSV